MPDTQTPFLRNCIFHKFEGEMKLANVPLNTCNKVSEDRVRRFQHFVSRVFYYYYLITKHFLVAFVITYGIHV